MFYLCFILFLTNHVLYLPKLKKNNMKKTMLFSAILLINCLSLQSQIKLIDAAPIVCPGDSIWADFKWDNKPGTTNFRFDYVINASPVGAHIWSKDNIDFYKLSKRVVLLDTIYTIKLQTKTFWQIGRAAFKTQEASDVFMVEVNCGTVGLPDLNMDKQKPVYFDINGNKCELIPGVLLIEQNGNTRRKVLFNN